MASYYDKTWDGTYTESGEQFWADSLTCGSNTLPFNTIIEVTNLKNGKKVICRVNDRGPYEPYKGEYDESVDRIPHKKRILDLSEASFKAISPLKVGLIKVKYKIIK